LRSANTLAYPVAALKELRGIDTSTNFNVFSIVIFAIFGFVRIPSRLISEAK